MNCEFSYRLFKNTFMCPHPGRGPVLLSKDGVAGPFDKGSKPPGMLDSAEATVLRALAREPLPDDPVIDAEPGADRDTYLLEFLQLDEGQIARARLIVKATAKIGKK